MAGLLSLNLSDGRIIAAIILSVTGVLLISLGIFLLCYFQFRKERKLRDPVLQKKREEILRRIEDMQCGKLVLIEEPEIESDETEEQEITLLEDEEEEEEEESAPELSEYDEDDEEDDGQLQAEVLKISSLSPESRKKLDLTEREYDDKKYSVYYNYSFNGAMRLSDAAQKNRFSVLLNAFAVYDGLEIRQSYRRIRVFKGRKLLSVITFRGKKLCAAFALDTKKYATSKYSAADGSGEARFKATPVIIEVSTDKRAERAAELIAVLAEQNSLSVASEPEPIGYDLEPMTIDEMYLSGLVRISFISEIN